MATSRKEMGVLAYRYYRDGFQTAWLAIISSARDFDFRDWNRLWPIFIGALLLPLSYLFLRRIAGFSSLAVLMGDSNGTGSTSAAAPATTTDSSSPEDICTGDIKVSKNLPTKTDLEKCAELPVLDVHSKKHTFESLYSGERAARHVLVLFIRHFFCGNCQEYLRELCSSITPESLLSLPIPTEIVIVGCGKPDLISFYAAETKCPFPIYADPTKELFSRLGMARTLELGPRRPDYMQSSLLTLILKSGLQIFRSGRNAFSGGDYWQVGGEFLFEDGQVRWCHRMKNTRDHVEVIELRKQLGLDDERPPVRKTWSMNLTNSSMARSLSTKRQSWSRNSSRRRESKDISKEGSLMDRNSVMEKVREEKEVNVNGDGGSTGTANGHV
ncbi:MAG: hypothetical protein Q9187_001504 [Circinaria calcarea]